MARIMGALFRRWAYWLTALTVLGLVVAGASGCPPWRAMEAPEVLGDLAAGPKPSRLKRIAPRPIRAPIACAVGLEALDVLIDEGLIEAAAELGPYMADQLGALGSPTPIPIGSQP